MASPFNSILLASVLLVTACQQSGPEPVLTFGQRSVALPEFQDRYRAFLDVTHLNDNLQFRYNFSNGLLDELAILSYADDIHYTDQPAIRTELDRIADQILLNRLYAVELEPELAPTEAELQRLFVWSQYRLHVQHLFCRTEEQAQAVARRLAEGGDWNELARELFADSTLANNGGDLGFIVLGDMDPAFEVVAFTLIDGEISQPVQTEYGYSIIRIIEREVDPFLIESDFQQKRKRLTRIARSHKKRPLVRQYTDETLAALDPVFHPKGRKQLFTHWENIASTNAEITLPGGDDPCLTLGAADKTYSVADALELLQELSPRQARLLHSPEQLEKALFGLVAREALLERARTLGLDRDPEVQQDIRQAKHARIIKNIIADVTAPLPQEDLTDNRSRYISFRDSLRKRYPYCMDSLQIKTFTLDTLPKNEKHNG
ncbi:MAG: peptidylprolyl isomerase [Fidelibacterota bacterium]